LALPLKKIKNIQSAILRHRVALFVLLAAAVYYPRFVKLPAGMDTFPRAAACLWNAQILQACDPGFTYPPFFALVMLPFAPMPMWLRDLVWYAVTLAATVGTFKVSEFIVGKAIATPLKRAELTWLRFFTLLLSAKLILAVFENQAYDALVILAVLIGLAALCAGRPFTAGAGLALATALKATPLIFLPYLLWKRYFVAAAAFVIVYATASLLPDILFKPAGADSYFSTWLWEVAGPSLGINPTSAPFAFWDGANILNHSLHGTVALNLDEAGQHDLFETVLAAADGSLSLIAIIAALVTLSPRRPQSIAIDGSLLLIAMLMLSPMTSRSHYVALLLPYMTLVALNLRDEHTAGLGRAVLAASFVLVTLTGNDAVGQAVTVWAYRHSVFGALVLLIYFAALAIERSAPASAAITSAPRAAES
jgi:alpha-1,2-mannosyltransferase